MRPKQPEAQYDVVIRKVNFCDTCVWSRGKTSDVCTKPILITTKKLVRSPSYETFHLKDYTRDDRLKCGPDGAWYKEKRRLWQRLLRWVHSG